MNEQNRDKDDMPDGSRLDDVFILDKGDDHVVTQKEEGEEGNEPIQA